MEHLVAVTTHSSPLTLHWCGLRIPYRCGLNKAKVCHGLLERMPQQQIERTESFRQARHDRKNRGGGILANRLQKVIVPSKVASCFTEVA